MITGNYIGSGYKKSTPLQGGAVVNTDKLDITVRQHKNRVLDLGGEVFDINTLDFLVKSFKSTNQWDDIFDIWAPGFGVVREGSNVSNLPGVKGNDFKQSTVANMPLLNFNSANGKASLRSDGSKLLQTDTITTIEQPFTFYILVKQHTWASGDWIINVANTVAQPNGLWQNSSSPRVDYFFGVSGDLWTNHTLNTWGLCTGAINVADSIFYLNNDTGNSGNAGSNDITKLRMFNVPALTAGADCSIALVIMKLTRDSGLVDFNRNLINSIYKIW